MGGLRLVILLVTFVVAGCIGAAPSGGGNRTPGPTGGGSGDGSPGGGAEPPPKDGPSPSGAKTGLVVIDIQQSFVATATRRNSGADIAGRVANSQRLLDAANAHDVPVLMTFEAKQTGDGALPVSLEPHVPAGTQRFTKTKFAAPSLPEFDAAVHASGLKRFVVIGSETDVCVLQTILGLRREGFEVAAVVDTIFTEEVHVGPTLRRFAQAGVAALKVSDAETLLGAEPSPLAHDTGAPTIVRPLEMGFVLNATSGLAGQDPASSQKLVRLKQLLLLSEWFKLPVFASDPASALAGLPADVKSVLTRPIQPLASRPASVTQVAIAGSHTGLLEASAALHQSGVDVFVLEDVLVGGKLADLEPAIVGGAVPSTYKMLYYELTQSVSDDGWPSQQWVADGIRYYYDATMAPEELPPIPE
jgi:nicotinamidase-related amidase